MAKIKGARRRCNKCGRLIFNCNCNESILRRMKYEYLDKKQISSEGKA